MTHPPKLIQISMKIKWIGLKLINEHQIIYGISKEIYMKI